MPTLIDRSLREDNPWSRLCQSVLRGLKRLGVTICLIETRAADQADAITNIPAGFSVERLSATACRDLLANAELRVSEAFLDAALARGDQCNAVRDADGAIVAYGWTSTTMAPHDGDLEVVVPAQHSYGYKALTLSSHRGHNFFPLLIQTGARMSLEQGVPYRVGFAELINQASLRAMRRAGYDTVGFAGYLRLGGRVVTFRSPGVRRLGFRFRRAQPLM